VRSKIALCLRKYGWVMGFVSWYNLGKEIKIERNDMVLNDFAHIID